MTDEDRDAAAKAEVLIGVVRAIDDPSTNPDAVLRDIVHTSLKPQARDRWFAVLLDAVETRDVGRATVAVVVLIFGEPDAVEFGWEPTPQLEDAA